MITAAAWLIGSALAASLVLAPLAFPASLDQEARQFTQQALESMFSHCGDSHYTKWYPMGFKGPTYLIVQFKGLTMKLTPQPLAASDQRQNIEWKGKAVLRSTARRSYPVDAATQNSWGEWLERRSAYDVDLLIQKKLGQWTLSVPSMRGPYSQTAFEPVECADVPQ
jgi:hypothetical protein